MKEKILSVSELTQVVKLTLEESIGFVTLQGEISNFKRHSSGHSYFSLKDENAQISCILWRSRTINFQPEDGMKVIVNGRLTVYPPRGNYQIDVTSMRPVGQGDLYLAFEALKKKLQEQGYFEPDRKKLLPIMPMHIGVATSPTGAAVRDIISTLERRMPLAAIYFRPTIVQGNEAAPDIIRAIKELQKTPAEVLIIGRGGGSLEDLWAFNMENVANTIYNSKLPIISAVGHETDFTIADFVADIRAATPTAAAEIASPRTIMDFDDLVEDAKLMMTRAMNNKIEDIKSELKLFSDEVISRRLIDKIRTYSQRVDENEYRIENNINNTLKNLRHRLQSLESHCRSLEPLAPMKRGFALIRSKGRIVKADETLKDHRKVEVLRENETAEARITKILPKQLFG